MNRLIAALVTLLAITTTTSAGNWPQWRGPTADGSAGPDADPPIAWDGATGKNIKWKAALTGKGSATPIVWGDNVFVLTAEKTSRVAKADEMPKQDPKYETKTEAPKNFYKFIVLCFDRNTGVKKWEQLATERVPHEGIHATHSYAAGSPTTDGERLYVSFGSFGNYCYDFAGNLLWSRDLIPMHPRYGWGEAVTPVIHGDSLLLNWDQEVNSALYCLDPKTGTTRWKAERDEKTTWSTPLVTEFAGRTQVIMNGTKRIRSYDLKDGKPIWECAGMTVNPIPSPLRVGDTVVCMSGYTGSAAACIPLDSTGDLGTTGKVSWRIGKGTPYVPSAALVGDRLYFTEKNEAMLTVLDTKTGKPVFTRERLPGASSFYASPTFAGGRVYFVDQKGTTLVLKPGDTVEVLATNKIADSVDASPVVVGKQLFIRGQKFLYCIEEK